MHLHDRLHVLGWDGFFSSHFEHYRERDMTPARVAVEHRGAYVVYGEHGESWAELSGRLRYETGEPQDLPAVGDWVAVTLREEGRATIHAVLPRKTKFSRKVAGFELKEQVLAANVDFLFLVTALDHDFNVRRIERYLTLGWESGAAPVIVLTKADLCSSLEAVTSQLPPIALGVPCHAVSGTTGIGIAELDRYLGQGKTVALVGSSGVGKSTLINRLVGKQAMATQEVRWDGRGRHTTTRRELIVLPSGGVVVDSPGMRELQLWEASDGLDAAFDDVARLAAACRFSDCSHQSEPGCDVKRAVRAGEFSAERLESYRKLQRELRYLETKIDERAAAAERRKLRARSRTNRKATQTRAKMRR